MSGLRLKAGGRPRRERAYRVDTAEQERERANSGTKAVLEAHRFDERALEAWLRVNVDGFSGPLSVRQFNGGQSNPTYQLVTPRRTYVLRRKPPGKLLPSAHAVDREHRIISALHAIGFPVAKPHGLCTDDGVIGTWFYVMEMVQGRVLWDQQLPQCAPAERRAIHTATIETLARLHSLDHRSIGLEDFGRPGNYMARQVARWTKQYRASETHEVPAMDRLIEWLPRTIPEQERTSIVHGDYRLDNMILHASEPRVVAVLDWELSTVGDPLADFTYVLTNWVAGALSRVPDLASQGLPTMEEAIGLYCRRTGRGRLEDLDWYLAYNLFRMAGINQGIAGRVRDGTATSPRAAEAAARVPALATLGWTFAQRASART